MQTAEPITYRAGQGTATGTVDADPITTEVIRHGLNSAAEQMKFAALLQNVTSSIPNSYNHWRQPPHGDAVMAIAAMSPGLYPALTAFTSADFSAQTPSGYAAFSTLTPSNTCPSRVRTAAPTRAARTIAARGRTLRRITPKCGRRWSLHTRRSLRSIPS